MKLLSLLSATAIIAAPAFGETTRKADAHEHGVGQLNIAFEGDKIAMEFHAPGADIVGFEYEAKSDEDHAKIDAALAVLAQPLELFVLPEAAGCKVVEAEAELEGGEHHEGHDDHDDEKHDDHDDHDDDKHDDHDDHGDEKHDDHDDHGDEAANHTEFHAEYLLECATPASATDMTFAYFEAFPNAVEIEVQIIHQGKASAFEVTRDAPHVTLMR